MTPTELKDQIVAVLEDRQGGDLTVIDIAEQTTIADYFVIATGKSTTQVRALVDSLEEKLEEKQIFAVRKEGVREGRWVVVDYSSVIVHIFNAEARDFYSLEQLWATGNNITKL